MESTSSRQRTRRIFLQDRFFVGIAPLTPGTTLQWRSSSSPFPRARPPRLGTTTTKVFTDKRHLTFPICLIPVEPQPSSGSSSPLHYRVVYHFNSPCPTTEMPPPDSAAAMVGMAAAALRTLSCHHLATCWANMWVQQRGGLMPQLLKLNTRTKNTGGQRLRIRSWRGGIRKGSLHLCMKSLFTLKLKGWNQLNSDSKYFQSK